jgi:hypothetical protein
MIKHLNLAQFKSRDCTQECGIDTHTLESWAWEQIFYSQGKIERLNGPKSVVGTFDEIRHAGKADGIES